MPACRFALSARPSRNVAFRSAKGRQFAELPATLASAEFFSPREEFDGRAMQVLIVEFIS
jgi:hypothetical protein